MDYNVIQKVFEKRIKEFDEAKISKIVKTAYKLYLHEFLIDDNERVFDEVYYKELVETTSPVIEEQYEVQDEDGSIAGDICRTALFAGLMCVTSRVYDDLDSIFARDCVHAGLDAAHYLMVNNIDIKALELNEQLAMLWAFTELSKTDVEIKNAYDHSMMAGMPQKMSRQKKYKMIVSALGKEIFDEKCFKRIIENEEDGSFDLVVFSSLIILLDEGDVFTDNIIEAAKKCIFNAAEENYKNDDFKYIIKLIASMTAEHILDKDREISQKPDSQLIKVIEYNVINQKKKQLTDEEKAKLKEFLNVLE